MSEECGLAMAHEADSLEAKFAAAVRVIRSLPEEGPFQPSDDMLLMFYSYYQQATSGPCNIPRPIGFWDRRDKAKWDAWSSLGNMSKEEAMRNYIEDIQLILETIPISEEVSDLVQKLGNFYTDVEELEEIQREEGAAENETDRRPFTRPFATHADEHYKPYQKPTMEGYGDLWDDIQNLPERDKAHSGPGSCSLSSIEGEESRESSESERNKETSEWRSEEENNGDDESITTDRYKQEERDWNPVWRLLMPKSQRQRSDTKGSGSSVELNVSSLTNGTRSSLNSEVEEEELACSIELCSGCNPYMHFNGQFTDERDILPGTKYRSTESDNEEFCDSMEDLAREEGLFTPKSQSPGSRAVSVRHRDLWFENNTIQTEGEDQVLNTDSYCKEEIRSSKLRSYLSGRVEACQTSRASCSSLCCVSENLHPVDVKKKHINEQIATALLRLQQDMNNVLDRLHTLELTTRSQSQSSPRSQEFPLSFTQKLLRLSWWPFEVSPLTAVLVGFWPLIAFWLVQLYHQRKQRKIP